MLQQYSLTANEAPQGRLSHFGALAICGTIVFSTLGTACAGATLSNPPKESAICKKTKFIIHEYPKTVKQNTPILLNYGAQNGKIITSLLCVQCSCSF